MINYPTLDSQLPFSDYIAMTRSFIAERRKTQASTNSKKYVEQALEANSPFELIPKEPILSNGRYKYGVLLIHGLFDGPFSLKDMGKYLQSQGILARAILLPGHGTTSSDLLHVSYHDWLHVVRYGVESLKHEVDEVFIMGYSTGAALAIYEALLQPHIAGIILLAPAIRIKISINLISAFHYLLRLFGRNNAPWLHLGNEMDYAKYKSIAFNAVNQVSKLTDAIAELKLHHVMTTPTLMVMTKEDETISTEKALNSSPAFITQIVKFCYMRQKT